MKFLFINLGEGPVPHGSGGTERISQIAKRFSENNIRCEFLGTIGLKQFLKIREINIKVHAIHLPFFLLKERSKFHRLLTYIWVSSKVPRFVKRFEADFIYSSSDYFPDVFASIVLKRRSSISRWISIIHHKAKLNHDNLFTFLSSLLAIVLQKFSWFLISKNANLVLLYDSNEGREISKSMCFKGKNIGFVRNGVDFSMIQKAKPSGLSLDILLCGGPRQSKGVMDLPPLLKLLQHNFPDIKVGIAGHGTDKVIAVLKRELKAIGMESNVIFFGNLSKINLYGTMKSAQIILSLSYEEGWGIAMREAIACGRPCLAYKLAAFQGLERHLRFIELGNIGAMSTEVTKLLSSTTHKQSSTNILVGQTWSEVASEELSLILRELP